MASKYQEFETSRLRLLPLEARIHDLDLSIMRALCPVQTSDPRLQSVASRVVEAKSKGASVIMMMGAHVLRSGVQPYLIDLMERGYISCISTNGAGVIHDFEFALMGQTTESVARYISEGQFGLWNETGQINDIVSQGAEEGLGLGESVGKAIEEGDFPFKNVSVFAAGYRLGIPLTVHVGIGYDIIHEHPNFDGAAFGATSYRDFLIYARVLEKIEGGVIMNFGSAVMAPEVFLKALAMVRNVAHQEARRASRFSLLVCDLRDLPDDFREEPERGSAAYYFRPWKTMLVRTVADGGESFYVKGPHARTVPELWTNIMVSTKAHSNDHMETK